MPSIYIFGHKNPDSDTICSSIAYAELKKSIGQDAVPYKPGSLNSETKFILKYFGIDEPVDLGTIKTQVSDLEFDDPILVSPSAPLRSVWNSMIKHSQKALPVVDDTNSLIGLATLSDITRNLMDAADDGLLSDSNTSYSNIVNTLEASLIIGETASKFVAGRVLIAAQHHLKIKEYVEGGDIVFAGIGENIREAINKGAALIICTCGMRPAPSDTELAKSKGCTIISTDYDTFTAAMLIRQSIPVEHVMTKGNIVTVRIDELIDDVKDRMLKTRFRSYPVVDDNGAVLGMISRYHLLSRRRKQVVLVDHNERSQTATGIDDAEIIEIIDHHRLGDIQTRNPILMKNEPVGSTATIVASLYDENGVAMLPPIAGILLSAVISDTLNFKSPTCTQRDIDTAERLAEVAEVDISDLALKILNAGSTLKGKTTEEIINGDLKEYTVGKLRLGIAQVYSIDSESLLDIRETLLEQMDYYCGKNGFSALLLLVTDLNRGGSEVLSVGERKDILYKAYSIEKNDSPVFLPGVLSRKKQVIPQIMSIEDNI